MTYDEPFYGYAQFNHHRMNWWRHRIRVQVLINQFTQYSGIATEEDQRRYPDQFAEFWAKLPFYRRALIWLTVVYERNQKAARDARAAIASLNHSEPQSAKPDEDLRADLVEAMRRVEERDL